MQYTDQEFDKLISDVEKEFTAHLAKAEENCRLAKAEDSAAPSVEPLAKAEEEKKPEEKKEEKKPEEKEPEAKEEPKEESKESKEPEQKEEEKKPEEAKEEEKKPEGEAAAPAAEDKGHDYDEEDLAHMDKMYMSMGKGELKAHHDSVRKALDAGMAKCGEMTMGKSETEPVAVEVKPEIVAEIVKEEPNKELELLKSEVETQKAKAEGLQKSLDAVSAFLTKLVEKKVAPQGKAITSLDVIAKSEGAQEEKTLSKSEIDSKLLTKAQDPKLEKSDRALINAFYLENGSINSISHLLK